ncbi:MAG: CBS domain-containing protein [Firmicutes bacterium]|nr:CBS domain-containing protein [Bacillota bacterium]
MFVKDKMTKNVITVSPTTNVLDALELMRKHKIRRLPVLDGTKLVGIVTEMDLIRVSPSPATSLSVYELNYLLAKMTVKEAMTTNPIVVSPDATLEEAALLMRENQIGGLPVVHEGELVGIITETNIFDAFIESMGLRRAGIRVALEVEDHPGVLAELTGLIYKTGINIISLATFTGLPEGRASIVVRLAVDSADPLIKELEAHGYSVAHVSNLG